MNTMFYPRLAATNLKKNAKIYVPYIITCILTVSMYYIIKSLTLNEGLNHLMGADTVRYTLSLGCKIVAMFAVIFLFYTNSFIIKNRKKEFGLFHILGMEKKHIAKIIAFENLYVTLISFVFGLFAGIILDKLMYLAIIKIIGAEIALGFYISEKAIVSALVLFGILFFFIFLNAIRIIYSSKTIELLQGGNVGEKEPKAKWFLALLGFVCLGTGYYLAVTVESAITALGLFFVAVILVIVGTYLVFTAGIIAMLKLLKKSKKFYYRTKHFISVSGMFYRMKQNAVGLANICILSTMVLVMISTTASLVTGIEDIVHKRYPYEIQIYPYYSEGVKEKNQQLVDLIRKTAAEENIAIQEEMEYTSLEFTTLYNGGTKFITDALPDLTLVDKVCNLFFITEADYRKYSGDEISLADDEVIFYTDRLKYHEDSFEVFGETYKIVKYADDFIGNGNISVDVCPTCQIVVKDTSIMEKIQKKQLSVYGDNASRIQFFYGADLDCDKETQIALADKIDEKIEALENDGISCRFECREKNRDSFHSLYGGLFFLGVFLGTLFMMATVLIIYYKQISEGYDDKKRFEIMQKVGMTEEEVKKTIHSQVVTVFFLPLVMAGVHTAFAFPMVRQIMYALMLTNTKLYITCTMICFLAFTVFYGIVYFLTAKVYYRIVRA